jgi:MFS family permease
MLLYRNTFAGSGLFPGGLVGLGQVIGAGAVGTVLAALVTPWVVRRTGKRWWVIVLLAVGGVGQAALALPLVPPTVVLAGFVLGFLAQGVKICVDTTLQESIDDDFRGRVFSVYDTVFNVGYVVALLVAAFVLPASGVSYPVLIAVGAGYLLTAGVYARLTGGDSRA